MVKTLNKLEMEGNFLNLMKAINEKSIVNNVLNGKRLKSFPLESGTMPTFATSSQFYGLPQCLSGKESPAVQETQEILVRSMGQKDSPGVGNGYPLQYFCL